MHLKANFSLLEQIRSYLKELMDMSVEFM